MNEQLVTATTGPAPTAHPYQRGASPRPYRAMAIMAALIATAFLLGLAVASGAKPEQQVAIQPTGSAFMGLTNSTAPYDLRFLDEMVAHHVGAILSVQALITNSTHPELRDLGRRIVQVQQQQIDQMRTWRGRWYAAAPPLDTTRMGMMSGGMMGGGMMGRGVLTATNAPAPYTGMMGGGGMMAGGAVADRMFLRMMIPHHQLAIDMAQDALVHAQHEELKQLARAIISGQAAEITEMEGDLKTWYGEDSTRALAAPMREMMQRMMGGTDH